MVVWVQSSVVLQIRSGRKKHENLQGQGEGRIHSLACCCNLIPRSQIRERFHQSFERAEPGEKRVWGGGGRTFASPCPTLFPAVKGKGLPSEIQEMRVNHCMEEAHRCIRTYARQAGETGIRPPPSTHPPLSHGKRVVLQLAYTCMYCTHTHTLPLSLLLTSI